jgi:hypothetical protein
MDWVCGTQDCYMAAGGFEGYVSKKDSAASSSAAAVSKNKKK